MRRSAPVDVALEVRDGVAPERRRDRPGLDQRVRDAAAGELEPERVGDPLERELRRHIGAAPGRRDDAEHRETSPPARAPTPASPAEPVGQVDLAEGLVSKIRARLPSAGPRPRRGRRRRRVERARRCVRRSGRAPPPPRRRAPPRRRGRARGSRALGGSRAQSAGLPAGREHPPAARRERARRVEADAGRAAGDKDGPIHAAGLAGGRPR